MGQKTHPYGLRLGIYPQNSWEDGTPTKSWKSRWFAKKDYVNLLQEDLRVRTFIKNQLKQAGISSIEIGRSSGRMRIKIFTARPGVMIGRRGSEIDKLRDELRKMTKSEVFIEPKEVPLPQVDAQLIAESVAGQLERRIHFRRAMKKAITLAMQKGAEGIKIQARGRLGGAEIARREQYKDGKIPLGTFRADIDYGFAEAHTTYGSIGVKTWVYRGEVLLKKEGFERQQLMAKQRQEAEEHAKQHALEQGTAGSEGRQSEDQQADAVVGKKSSKGKAIQGSVESAKGSGPLGISTETQDQSKEGAEHAPDAK